MDPQFGGVSYPETANYLGGATMIQSGVRPNGATRAWAISSIVLGSIYLLSLGLLILMGQLSGQHQHHVHMPMSGALVALTLSFLLSIPIAFGFMSAGGCVLGQLDLGRKGLIVISGAAIVVSLVGLVAIWSVFNDPHVIAMLVADAPQNPQMAGPVDAYHAMRMGGMLLVGMTAIISAIQVIYCGFLCQHMSSRSARAAMKRLF